jgi:GT2 family glycosyltransferase
MIGLNELDTGQFGEDCRQVDFVSGCAMLVKVAVLQQVDMLDERFFAYFEEAEWCVRARRAGFIVVNVPNAKIWHKIPLDARDSSPLVHYYMTRNRLLFLGITGATLQAWLYTLFVEYLRTLISWSLRTKWGHKKLHRKMMLRAIIDAGLGRWGKCSANQVN